MDTSTSDYAVSTFSTISAAFVGLGTFVWAIMKHRAEVKKGRIEKKKSANQALYQTLELASIDLFRFEASHEEMIQPFWEADKPCPNPGTARHIIFMNYLCQNLNLFEMAIRFRIDGVFEDDVFLSWIDWMHLIAKAPGFAFLWETVQPNYVSYLGQIMELGLKAESKETFKDDVLRIINWAILNEEQKEKREEVTCQKSKPSSAFALPTFFEKKKPCPDLEISWAEDPKNLKPLIDLFVANATETYISQGEILCGRAKTLDTWVDNLPKVLEEELLTCIPGNLSATQGKAVLGAWHKGRCVGFLIVSVSTGITGIPYASLEDMVVAQDQRGKGIAKAMMQTVEAKLKSLGIRHFILETGRDNPTATIAFEKCGFSYISKSLVKAL